MPVVTIAGLSISEAISVYRKRAGMSQSELGEKTGVSRNTISLIEKGDGNPTLKTVEHIMAALGLVWKTELIEWEVKKL